MSCPCDEHEHPSTLEIPAGQTSLARQAAGFPEFRRALLAALPEKQPLAKWRAREAADLGVMLLEMWAYVADVLGFYDERIADETYLRTAKLDSSLRSLVEHVGYIPRPGVAAEVRLAALVDGRRAVDLPVGTAFRSEAFGTEPPQVYEAVEDRSAHPAANQWTIGPQRSSLAADSGVRSPGADAAPSGTVLTFVPNTLGLRRDSLVLFHVSGASPEARRVLDVGGVVAADGNTYAQVTINQAIQFDSGTATADVTVRTPSLKAVVARNSPLPLPGETPDDSQAKTMRVIRLKGTQVYLDAVYRQIAVGDDIIVSNGADLAAATITAVREAKTLISGTAGSDTAVVAPVTRIDLSQALPDTFTTVQVIDSLVFHFNMVDGGTLTSVAKTQLTASDVTTVTFDGVLESPPLPDQIKEFLLQDKDEKGAEVDGSVSFTDAGTGTFKVDSASQDALSGTTFKHPINVFGNVLRTTRGESVTNEVLGGGDATIPFQTFTLKKKPLTYVSAPTLDDERGIQSTLQVSVNGILWKEVRSFFGKGPEDEVYTVRHGDDQSTTITFGDGVHGRRVPSGTDNVTASYRFGAGASAPPANTIRQLAKPVKGLSRVFNAVAARGGADPESPQAMRTAVPRSVLTLGRAVSIQDFQALVSNYAGVDNASTIWAFDDKLGRPAVKSWIIGDTDPTKLRRFLRQQADPAVAVEVFPATAVDAAFLLELQRDPRFDKEDVERRVADVLFGDEGILTPKNIAIGNAVYRSQVSAVILRVAGVVGINGFTIFPFGQDTNTLAAASQGVFLLREGEYFRFQPPGSFCTVIQSVEATGLLGAQQ